MSTFSDLFHQNKKTRAARCVVLNVVNYDHYNPLQTHKNMDTPNLPVSTKNVCKPTLDL